MQDDGKDWRAINCQMRSDLCVLQINFWSFDFATQFLTQQFQFEDDTDIGQTYCRMLSLTWACIAFYLHTNAQVQQSIPALKMRLGKHLNLQTCKYFLCLCHANTCATISIFDKMKGEEMVLWQNTYWFILPYTDSSLLRVFRFFAIPFENVLNKWTFLITNYLPRVVNK